MNPFKGGEKNKGIEGFGLTKSCFFIIDNGETRMTKCEILLCVNQEIIKQHIHKTGCV